MQDAPRYVGCEVLAAIQRIFGVLIIISGAVAVLVGFISMIGGDRHVRGSPIVIYGIGAMVSGLFNLACGEVLTMIRHIAQNSFKWRNPAVVQGTWAAPVPSPVKEEFIEDLELVPRNNPVDPSEIESALGLAGGGVDRTVVCSVCGRKIRIPGAANLAPGDRAKCPVCKAMIVV